MLLRNAIELSLPGIEGIQEKFASNTVRSIVRRPELFVAASAETDENSALFEDKAGRKIGLLLQARAKDSQWLHPAPIFKVKERSTLVELNRSTKITWNGTKASAAIPSVIVESWLGKFLFVEENEEDGSLGLREPQIGALHAILGHLAVDTSPITVVMPTGTGKTETMLSLLAYRRPEKILILVPTDALRTQLADKFVTFGHLPDIGVLPKDVMTPRVCVVSKGIHNADEVGALIAATNVFVATPDILNASDPQLVETISGACSILFVDEAHHITAATWKTVKDRFTSASKPVIQFTATPFRNDGGNLEGKIIFNYPLARAQEKGYFKPIRFLPVTEYLTSRRDRSIAEQAIQVLRSDLKARHDHVMMARVSSKARAKQVAAIYSSLQREWEPQVIYSSMSKNARMAALQELYERRSRICVCVKMLGEGFDFPNLKIAAIHDPHKSLAVTLQFVGRFTRKLTGIGDAAFIANIADPGVEGDLQSLYAQSPDWDRIIRQQSQNQIEREIRHQELIEGFRDEGDLKKVVSLWNLRPAFSMMVFSTHQAASLDVSALEGILPKGSKPRSSYNPQEHIYVCVAERNEEVTWGRYKGIKNYNLELLVARLVPASGVLFVHASDYDFFKVDRLARLLVPTAEALVGEPVFRVFSGVERPMVRNLGARKTGDISFTMHFGPNVLDVMTAVEKGTSELSNLAGWGYEDGERCTWGCSQRKGKVWSMGGGDILDWINWTDRAWKKLSNSRLEKSEIIRSFLCARIMTEGRPESAPISIQWGDTAMLADEERVVVFIGLREFRLSEVDLRIDEFSEEGPILFSVCADDTEASYQLLYSQSEGDGIVFKYEKLSNVAVGLKFGSRDPEALDDYARRDPLVVTYADGKRSYNQFIVDNPVQVGLFDINRIIPFEWAADGIDIRVESQGPERNPHSIQNRMARYCHDSYEIIFDDDGSGEAGDLVCLRYDQPSNCIETLLVHCKFSLEDSPGGRVKDLYEVSGQAQKCIQWKHGGFARLVTHLKNREDKWRVHGNTRFLKGDLAHLSFLKDVSRKAKTKLEVWVVQPGVSKNKITDSMRLLLGASDEYLSQTSNAVLRVFTSR